MRTEKICVTDVSVVSGLATLLRYVEAYFVGLQEMLCDDHHG